MSRPTRTVTATVALAAGVVALTTACGPGSDATPAASTSSTATTAAPTPTSPSPSKTETVTERDSRLAGAAVTAYWAQLDELASDPNKKLSELATVARDPALAQWQQILTLRRAQGATQVGSTVVEPASATKNPKGQWAVTSCIDVGKVNLVDKDGKSVVKAGRPPRVKYDYVIVKDEGVFYVVQDKAVGVC